MRTVLVLILVLLPAVVIAGDWSRLIDPELGQWEFVGADGDPCSVKDHVLRISGEPQGVLQTRLPRKNFLVRLQWRWPEGSAGGNSGLLLHSEPAKAGGWPRCVEVQLKHGSAGDFWLIGGPDLKVTGTEPGKGTRRIARLGKADLEKKIGAWNDLAVLCFEDRITVAVNQEIVNHGTGCDVREGFIGLQSEGAPIEFRQVWIREATAETNVYDDGAIMHDFQLGVLCAHNFPAAEFGQSPPGCSHVDTFVAQVRGLDQHGAWKTFGWSIEHIGGGIVRLVAPSQIHLEASRIRETRAAAFQAKWKSGEIRTHNSTLRVFEADPQLLKSLGFETPDQEHHIFEGDGFMKILKEHARATGASAWSELQREQIPFWVREGQQVAFPVSFEPPIARTRSRAWPKVDSAGATVELRFQTKGNVRQVDWKARFAGPGASSETIRSVQGTHEAGKTRSQTLMIRGPVAGDGRCYLLHLHLPGGARFN